jgi:hypothetical protein
MLVMDGFVAMAQSAASRTMAWTASGCAEIATLFQHQSDHLGSGAPEGAAATNFVVRDKATNFLRSTH